MTEPAVPTAAPVEPIEIPSPIAVQRPLVLLFRRAWSLGRTKFGIALVVLLVLLALVGPYVTPHSPSEFVDAPYAHPSGHAALGTDHLGQDVLSRFLAGGIVVVEFIFGYAGIGGALVDGVTNRDLPVVQTVVMLIAAVYVVLNLLADIATILVSPRLRTALR